MNRDVKKFSVFLLVAALAGCEKHDDVARLQAEAGTVAKYYQPRLDALGRRLDAIFARGKTIAPGSAGVQDASKRLYDANEHLAKARAEAAEIEKKAGQLAKDRNEDELAKLVDESEEHLTEATVAINDDLLSVESWLAVTELQVNRTPAPPPAPTPEPTGAKIE